MGRIVVGIDGSPDSRAALDWALAEAEQHGHGVTALHVYGLTDEHNPFLAAYASFATGGTAPQSASQAQRWKSEREEATRRQATEALASIVHEVAAEHPKATVEQVVKAGGRPARALIDTARGCTLLVVGARGRGGFRSLRLGSTAEKCVRHAGCSVLVARAPR